MMYSLSELALGLLMFTVLEPGRAAAALTAASADPPAPVWLGTLAKRCSFKLGETSYDLCPIVEGNEGGWTVQSVRKTPPTVTKTSYKIDLRKPLERDANVPREEQVSRIRILFSESRNLRCFTAAIHGIRGGKLGAPPAIIVACPHSVLSLRYRIEFKLS